MCGKKSRRSIYSIHVSFCPLFLNALRPLFILLPPIPLFSFSNSHPMKDLSFILLKNSLGGKMKKGLRNFCNGVGSTSTLNQNKLECDLFCMVTPSVSSTYWDGTNLADSAPTLEEMILQLELEEDAIRKAKLDGVDMSRRRMSCVDNSDILRSARNALNQYPRFSVDGRDAMYRSSFRNLAPFTRGGHKSGRTSVCHSSGHRRKEKLFTDGFDLDLERTLELPPTIAGESVLWCKPGVVAKLMGLEAMPVPTGSHKKEKSNLSSTIRRENVGRVERQELEKRFVIDTSGCRRFGRGMAFSGSNSLLGSTTGYCIMKPTALEPKGGQRDWEARHVM